MKPTLDKNGRLVLRDDYRISSLNCGGEDFAIACMRSNLKYGKNQRKEDVKSHHYIISFDELEAKALSGEQISLADLAEAIKADEKRGGKDKPEKKPSIRAQLKADKERAAQRKTAAKAKSQDLERS